MSFDQSGLAIEKRVQIGKMMNLCMVDVCWWSGKGCGVWQSAVVMP
jgi:hypothetical protein